MIYQIKWLKDIVTGVCEGNDEASDSCEKTGGYLSFHSIQILLLWKKHSYSHAGNYAHLSCCSYTNVSLKLPMVTYIT